MGEDRHPADDAEPTSLESSDLEGTRSAHARGEGPIQEVTGRRLGDFELLQELGRGGMGIVYEARQVSLSRRVALKVLPPALGLTGQAIQRFGREARAAAQLHHTNIVPVHAIGEQEGHHFYAMDLIEGQSLDRVLRELIDEGSSPLMEATLLQTTAETGTRPGTASQEQVETSVSDSSAGGREWFDAVARLMADVADGLHYAHGRGIVHRDIKPANLMLSKEGRLCITDFGLARVAQEPGMTVSGSFLGTPAYMSPEQIAAGRVNVDHRADIYSLGAVLYEMLALQRPFPGESREQILAAILSKDPRPPRRFNRRIPVDLETICLKALEKDPDRRYQSAGELARDLRQYLQRGLITARRAGIARRTWKSIRRHPVAATVAVALLVVITVSVVTWQVGRGERARRLVADSRLALREGTYRDGLRLVDRAVALDPGSVEARLTRARLLSANFRFHEAADESRVVLRDDPRNWEAHAILAGLARYPGGDGVAGIDPGPHLAVVESSAPESAEAFCLRALVTKDPRRRIEMLDRALDLNPGDALALVARMTTLDGLKDHELVLSEADRLITARPKSAEGWRFKALSYRQQQDFDHALNAIERAMAVDDLDPWNYIQRSRILADSGKHDEALSDLDHAIELDPALAESYEERALRLNGMGRFEEALADARRAIELDPDGRQAIAQLLRAQLSLGREDEVRATLDELSTNAGGWAGVEAQAWAHRTAADDYRQLKDYDRAMESVERAIAIAPGDFEGFVQRMRIHRAQGEIAAAVEDCDAVAGIDLDGLQELYDRGRAMSFQCGRPERAVQDFTRVIELAPKWHLAYLQRGTAYKRSKRYDEALADLNRAIELAPLFAATYNNRSNVFGALGRFEDALADRRRVLELRPYHPNSWTNYGISLFSLGRLEDALAAHEKAIELAPRQVNAHENRAVTLAWLGRCDEAASGFERAAGLGPARSDAILAAAHLSHFYYNCPDHYDPAAALRHARAAHDADPRLERGTLADALFRSADYAEAKRIYAELLEENPGAETGFQLAMCLWHLGERTEARRLYDRFATWMDERAPEHPRGLRQRREAAELLGVRP